MSTPVNATTLEAYQGKNVDILCDAMLANGWTNPRFVTFVQAKSEDCYPRKGSHGVQISRWGVDESKPDADGKPTKFVKTYTVFNVEQLGGKIPPTWADGDMSILQVLYKENLLEWSEKDLYDTLEFARSRGDFAAQQVITTHFERRERDLKRAENTIRRASVDDVINVQIQAAEQACNGFLVNREGLAVGVTARNLWTWTLRRAKKYATEDLLRYWAEYPRPTKLELLGDVDARTRNIKECGVLI